MSPGIRDIWPRLCRFPGVVAVPILLAACGPAGLGPSADPHSPEWMNWDTAFSVADIRWPDDSILARAAVEMGEDYRLSRFFAKCESTRLAKIGFIGGSITEGAGASGTSSRYSSRLCGFLRAGMPGVHIREVNAGIGATTSRLGCSRVQEDLLAHDPDLIVIDFAVNDDLADTATSTATLEGLVRQCLRDPDVPVLLMQFVNRIGDSANHLAQHRLARHYGLPVISYRSALWPLLAGGNLEWSDLSPDDVHPNDAGHLVAGYLVYSRLKAGYALRGEELGGPRKLPTPLATDLYQSAGFLGPGDPVSAVISNSGWNQSVDENRRYGFESNSRGDRLVLRIQAREATFSFRCSKDLDARVLVRLDGIPVDTLSSHFPGDWGGGYLKASQAYRSDSAGIRILELENISGGLFDLRYLLYAR